MDKNTLIKIGTLGGQIRVNKDNLWMYGNTSSMTTEKLFGIKGPLHPGMPCKEEVAISTLHSDTKSTLIKELVEQTHLTREEAERTVRDLLQSGVLEEVNDPTLGKVLVFRGGAHGH